MLCAALLRSFGGQHSEKMKGSARGNWDPREVFRQLKFVVSNYNVIKSPPSVLVFLFDFGFILNAELQFELQDQSSM